MYTYSTYCQTKEIKLQNIAYKNNYINIYTTLYMSSILCKKYSILHYKLD